VRRSDEAFNKVIDEICAEFPDKDRPDDELTKILRRIFDAGRRFKKSKADWDIERAQGFNADLRGALEDIRSGRYRYYPQYPDGVTEVPSFYAVIDELFAREALKNQGDK